MKKYSSGFHEEYDKSMRKFRQKNGETSSTSSEYNYRQNNGPKYPSTPPPAPVISPLKRTDYEVVEINSDSEEDISYDNNNEEALPDRHRIQDSVDTEKRDESTSSDVIFVGDSTEEIERLSWITSNGKDFLVVLGFFAKLSLFLVHLDPDDRVSAADFKILKLLGTGAYGR
jgi:hypothetical protein